jgi:predicted phosphodiesterase
MRLVATSDTHFVPVQGWIPGGDVFIHAGDLMTDGYPSEWKERVDWLAALPHAFKIFVCGNHDFHLQVYPGPALQNLRAAGVLVVGRPAFRDIIDLPNGMRLLGLPGVSRMRNWAFNWDAADLIKYIRTVRNEKVDIIVSHCPPKNVLDFSERDNVHAGINEYNMLLQGWGLERGCMPKIWICGHTHEAYGTAEKANCKFYNVAMCNRRGEHVNPPLVLDI